MEKIRIVVLKVLKWLGIFVGVVLLLMFLVPLLFPGTISEQVKKFANKKLAGKLDYKAVHLTFFRHFPSLTVSVDDLLLKGSKPFQDDTLLAAKEVAAGINLKDLIFGGTVKIDEIYVSDAYANVYVNSKGEADYNVYVSSPAASPKDTTEKGASIKLELIKFKNWHVSYIDHSAGILVDAKGLNYTGKGGLSEDIFDLQTNLGIGQLDFSMDGIWYAQKKALTADLVTSINTHALTFKLKKNELKINDLPLKFTGFVSILKDGYDLDIKAASENTTIRDMISVLPPQYLDWSKDTKIEGKSDLRFSLKGQYSVPKKLAPDFTAHLLVNKGTISNAGAPVPMNNLNMDLGISLPALDMEQLGVDLKTLSFDLGKDNTFRAVVQTQGYGNMKVNAMLKGGINLQTLDAALGLKDVELRGMLTADLTSDGIFNFDKKLFPKTNGYLNVKDGWLKTGSYPNPIQHINLAANITDADGTFKSLGVKLSPFQFDFEGNPVFVSADLQDFSDMLYHVRAKGVLNVGRIYQIFAQKGIDVTGIIKADLSLNGRESYATSGQYNKLDNKGTLVVKNVKATTSYLPRSFFLKDGTFQFENEKMWFRKFNATYGHSDFALNGYMLNTINYFLARKGTLHGNFELNSDQIMVDEFMALKKGDNNEGQSLKVQYAKAENPKSSGVVIVPKNLDVALTVNARRVNFKGLDIDTLRGTAAIKDGQILLKNTSFDMVGSRMTINARYQDKSPLSASFDVGYQVMDFNVQRAYKELAMVRTMATSAKDVSGIVSLDYKLAGDLDENMEPIYPSLAGGGVVNLKDVAVKNIKMLSVVGDNSGINAFNNPDMTGVNIVTHIKDDLIHIDKFTFKVSILRPSISGTASFKGLLDILVRVGLPPAGLIGIPVAVTGTSDKPKLKFFSRKGQGILTAVYNSQVHKVERSEKRDIKKSKKDQRKLKKAQVKKAKAKEKEVDKEVKKIQ